MKTAALLMLVASAYGQSSQAVRTEWRRVGNTTLALGLASPAGGPIRQAWFSPDGRTIYILTPQLQVWQTSDLENWTLATGVVAPLKFAEHPVTSPEADAQVVSAPLQRSLYYAAGTFVWRSEDGGGHWANLSAFHGTSILGGRLTDVAISPVNPDEIVVAGANGVWRSVDAGASWSGLNDKLPNLPLHRLLDVPSGERVTRVQMTDGLEAVWASGDRAGWRPATDSLASKEISLRGSAAAALPGISVSTAARIGDSVYAGTDNGNLFFSSDRGQTWRQSPEVAGAGRVDRIYSDSAARFAVAITASDGPARVLRTVNGGVFWDDITADLPPGAVHGITADRATGAVYLASDAGVFMTYTDSSAPSPATPWTRLREEPARDVMLDAGGNQLYAGLTGLGVIAALAPHRLRDPRVVSAGDRILRAAAPGSLLSVIGAPVDNARAGDQAAIVLASGDTESQVQLPYDLPGSSVLVSLTGRSGRLQVGLPVAATSPSIFLDHEGSPVITNANSGLTLDASAPARANARIQILVTGLGQVTPAWPAGLAAPLQDPPKVIAPVRVYLDRVPVEVARATLAPGYAGLYLLEFQLPAIVNRGPADMYIETADGVSNHVQVWLEP